MDKKDLKQYGSWWYCENILCHEGQVALMRMDFPRVFILIRDYAQSYFMDFDEFKNKVAEVNFLTPKEREGADIEGILTEAWNFLVLTERKEEEMWEENNGYEEDF